MDKKHLAKKLRIGQSGKREKSLAWKGGRRLKEGYIMVLARNHPYAGSNGYIREHRLVMEKSLGRYLLPSEFIDHINEDKTDNRIENLRIVTNAENTRFYQVNHSNPFAGRKHTIETINIIKEKRKLQVGVNHPFFGKHHTEETKRKISETKTMRMFNYA